MSVTEDVFTVIETICTHRLCTVARRDSEESLTYVVTVLTHQGQNVLIIMGISIGKSEQKDNKVRYSAP